MKTNLNENIILIDVDNTLILHPPEHQRFTKDALKTTFNCIELKHPYTEEPMLVKVSEKHTQLIKNYHARGFHVRVHSGNGAKYAQSIINQLGLTYFVTDVETKPTRYIDDLDASKWLGTRIFEEEKAWEL